MRAYILAAGNGSRLRPLTNRLPKPMVPLMNRPLISHLVDHIRPHVDALRLNVSYNKAPLIAYLQTQPGVSYYDEGEKPLGSAATIARERAYCSADLTLVSCGDLLCNWDIEQMVAFHTQRNALVTVAVRRVADPRRYGVVVSDAQQRITRFVEKPQLPPSSLISCGIYLFSPELFAHWNDQWRDIGGDLLPDLVAANLPVYAWSMDATASWSDIGNPTSYLEAHLQLTGGTNTIAPEAQIDPQAVLERSVVGAGAIIAGHSRLERCVVWPGAVVQGLTLSDCIVTPEAVVAVQTACQAV